MGIDHGQGITAVRPGFVIATLRPVPEAILTAGAVPRLVTVTGTIIPGLALLTGPVITSPIFARGSIFPGSVITGPVITGPVITGPVITGPVVAVSVPGFIAVTIAVAVAIFVAIPLEVIPGLLVIPRRGLVVPALRAPGLFPGLEVATALGVSTVLVRLLGLVGLIHRVRIGFFVDIDVKPGGEDVAARDVGGGTGGLEHPQDPEVMFCVLEIVLRQNPVAG